MTSIIPSRTASPALAATSSATLPDAPGPIQYTIQERTWRTLRDALKVATIPLDPLPYVPYGTPPELATHIDAAYNAGILTGVGRNTPYDIVTLPNTSAAMECQRKYFQHGLRYGISLTQTTAVPAPTPTPAPVPQVTPEARDRLAPKLNPPKTFTGIRTEYQAFILQLNLIFNSDPCRYQGDATKISYAASFLSGSALEWFKPHVSDEGIIDFETWNAFVTSLKAAFDDPDARATAE